MQDLALFRARFILFARKLQDTCKKILHVQDLGSACKNLARSCKTILPR